MDGIKVTVKYGVSPSDAEIYLTTSHKDFTKLEIDGEILRVRWKQTLWSSETYELLDKPSRYITRGTEATAYTGDDPTPPPVTFKITTERRKVIIPIPHEVKIEKLSSKDTDFENYIPGKNGSKVEVYEVKTYSDGKREERKLREEDVVQPVPNVRQIGTKEKVPISPEKPPNYPKAEGNVKWYRQKIEYDDGTIEYTKAWRDGVDGQNGTQGADGKSSYLHIAYADDGYGGGFSFSTEGNKKYLGTYTDSKPQASYDYTKYTWVRIKGEDGLRGLQGLQGRDGKDGIPGASSYTHIAYANSPQGSDFSTADGATKKYIGIYVDDNKQDSEDYRRYKWTLIKGADGAKGLPGTAGADGKTPYLHIAYANSPQGSDFSVSDSRNKKYLGTYTDFLEYDSTDYRKYNWTLIKGRDGKDADYTQFRSEYSSELSQLKDSISSKVSQSVYDQKNREVEKRISTVEQKSDTYALEVSTVKRNLDTKTDSSDVRRIFSRLELTPEQITAVTKTFDIRGALKAYTGEIGPFIIGEFWGGYGPWITTKNWQIGMGGDGNGKHKIAFWANWGNSWYNPGSKSWYVQTDGYMSANNGAWIDGENVTIKNLKFYRSLDRYGIKRTSNVGLLWGGQENDIFYEYNNTSYSLWSAVKNASSDRKLKENITDTKHKALDTIKELKFKEYDWIKGKFHQKHTNIGTIAQEVQKIDDSLVFKDGDILKLDVLRLANLALKGVQELSEENKQLKEEIAEIKKMLEDIKNEKANN